ncbi:hypothetical protein KP77_23590 [Jeotgalibacillus alimentarius]|uniref:Uncharacterized protein n=1 Tax=Jeotgalibacillus alimentarius TaxID=135826 RepID=A0A0C2S2R9_9BACL|nr:hypothetical protein KP77_23590 [Jeotgalibacillus alimentarius]
MDISFHPEEFPGLNQVNQYGLMSKVKYSLRTHGLNLRKLRH